MKKQLKSNLRLLGLLLCISASVDAQCRFQTFNWGADAFGSAVAIEDVVAVVGARLHDFPVGNAGRVFVYRQIDDAWLLEQELMAFDASGGAAFGTAVAISPDVVVVGAPGDDGAGDDAGAVYIFRHDGVTWEPEVKITANDAGVGAAFGTSVSIFLDTVLIGAAGAGGTGRAYIYQYDGASWTEQAILNASDATIGDEFGNSVSISANSVIVGAPGHDGSGAQAGAAYIFRDDGVSWSQEAQLLAPDASPYDRFGISVAMNGFTVTVGAPGDDLPTIPEIGAAYIFRSDGSSWTHEQKLVPQTPTFTGWFGWSVSLSQDVTVIGSPTASLAGNGGITTFVYDGNQWNDRPETPASGDDALRDGFSVATSRGWAISGAPVEGRAHFLEVDGPDCDGDGVPDSCQIATGLTEDCDLDGVPDLCGLADFAATSGPLLDFDGLVEQQFLIATPPSAGEVSLAFEATGDLASPNEAVDVFINDTFIGRIFDGNGNDCPAVADAASLTVEGALFDALVAAGDAVISLIPTAEVDAALCPGSNISVTVTYQQVTALDCDASGVVDGCEILSGVLADCDGDGVPDVCEVDTFHDSGPSLGPLEADQPLIHVIPSPPPGSDVLLSFTATGDLGALTESVQIRLNGSIVGSVFGFDGADCSAEASTTLTVPGVVYNFLTAGTNATFTLVPSATVNVAECPGSSIRFDTDYQRLMPDDCDGNGIPDDCDLASGDLEDNNGNGVPDVCESSTPNDCNGNGIPDNDDIASGDSADCNGNDTPDECDIGAGIEQDCDGDGAIDICEIIDGTELDCDGDGIPDACNVNVQDCNNNGVFDSCEIAAGTVEDCDENGIPDECLVAPVLRSAALTGPVGYQYPALIDLTELPPAVSPVTLRLEVIADLGETTESAEAFLAGTSLGIFFQSDGSNCPDIGDIEEIDLDAATFNTLVVDGNATLEVFFSASVDPVLCDNPSLTWTFTYEGQYGEDLNGDGIPDGCQQPFQVDCDGDGITDGEEIATGTADDCNGNDIPDDCEIDAGDAPDADGDGVIDSCVVRFIRGDCDGATGINIADAVGILQYLFAGGEPATCPDACDFNDDGALDIGDPVALLAYLFSAGSEPSAPWPDCGPDPGPEDALDCIAPEVCR
jgi:hypothetical protein